MILIPFTLIFLWILFFFFISAVYHHDLENSFIWVCFIIDLVYFWSWCFFFIWVFFFFILEVEKLNLGGNWELGILMICLLLWFLVGFGIPFVQSQVSLILGEVLLWIFVLFKGWVYVLTLRNFDVFAPFLQGEQFEETVETRRDG